MWFSHLLHSCVLSIPIFFLFQTGPKHFFCEKGPKHCIYFKHVYFLSYNGSKASVTLYLFILLNLEHAQRTGAGTISWDREPASRELLAPLHRVLHHALSRPQEDRFSPCCYERTPLTFKDSGHPPTAEAEGQDKVYSWTRTCASFIHATGFSWTLLR
jgi:hypothetical protein